MKKTTKQFLKHIWHSKSKQALKMIYTNIKLRLMVRNISKRNDICACGQPATIYPARDTKPICNKCWRLKNN